MIEKTVETELKICGILGNVELQKLLKFNKIVI